MRKAITISCGLAMICATADLGCLREDAVGRISVALSEDLCSDYCLVALRATLYPESGPALPIGPSLQLGCGEEVAFAELPAGERVVVSMQAYDITGQMLFDGSSEALTIIADGETEAPVPLVAAAPPRIFAVAPDPVVTADQSAEVTISGKFGDALGDAGVELGGVAYEPATWSWSSGVVTDEIALTLPANAVGGELRVRQCGVVSDPVELRVVPATLGESPVAAPACSGAIARAVAARGDEVWVGWSCNDGGGTLTAMKQHEALCPLDPGAAWSLDDTPMAVAVRESAGWVASASGVDMLDLLDSGAPPARVSTELASALGATASEVYAVVGQGGGRLARVSASGTADVSGLDAGLTLGAIAATDRAVFVAAANAGGEGRLVSVPDGGVVTVTSLASGDGTCRAPEALAVDTAGDQVVLACAGGDLAMWRVERQSLAFLTGLDAMEALAFDDGADVVFGMARGGVGLSLVALNGSLLHRFSLPARPGDRPALLVALGAHRLAAPTGSSVLAVLTPFDGRGPCAAEEIP